MLSSIYIENLFGLYTYKLALKPTDGDPIRFITGPNGYGKTTILNILESVFSCEFSDLLKARFDVLKLAFDDGCSLNITQKRASEASGNDIYSDEPASSASGLDIKFYMMGAEACSTLIGADGVNQGSVKNSSLHVYLKSQPVYYIRDARLHKSEAELSVSENAKKMIHILTACRHRIDGYKTPETGGASISENEYDKVRENLKDDIETLLSCDILDEDPFPPYDRNKAKDLKALSERVTGYIKEERTLIEKLRSFKSIITKCDFSDKLMRLDCAHGYCFSLDNKDKTLLQAGSLSSGEQHSLIIFFDLLFRVDDASLVLIDEPEMSFHVMWKMNFLKNLRAITSLRKLQCVVCTHSPRIFGNNFDLTVDLYKQSVASKKRHK